LTPVARPCYKNLKYPFWDTCTETTKDKKMARKHNGLDVDWKTVPGYIVDELMDSEYTEADKIYMAFLVFVKIAVPIILLMGLLSVVALVNYFWA
jgi:hypothetical protein